MNKAKDVSWSCAEHSLRRSRYDSITKVAMPTCWLHMLMADHLSFYLTVLANAAAGTSSIIVSMLA